MEQLQPGALIKIGERKFEYVGLRSGLEEGEEPQLVGRINPDKLTKDGALHILFSLSEIEQKGVKVGPFGEIFPYSTFSAERQAWENNFPGVEQVIPNPPQELIDALSKAKEEGIETLAPHFLPAARFTEDKVYIMMQGNEVEYPYPKGWVKPGDFLFEKVKNSLMPRNSLRLDSGWIIIDTTKRPDFNNGAQMYPNDPFKTLLQALQALGNIQGSSESGSRFWISADELDQHVMLAIAELLGTEVSDTSLPTVTEFNVIGNLFHKDFGQATTYEWLFNKVGGDDNRLCGGNSENGGLAHLTDRRSNFRGPLIGFRPMVIFPSK